MRQAGTLPSEREARRLADYLLTQGIEAEAQEGDGGWAIWVYDSGNLERARAELGRFSDQPDDPRYRRSEPAAARLRDRAEREEEAAVKRFVDVRRRWGASSGGGRYVTVVLLVLAMVVALFTQLGADERATQAAEDLLQLWLRRLALGEVWRLLTPIFIHYGPLHLLFNAIVLWDFGGIVEGRKGSLRFLALVLLLAVTSNLAQAVLGGPHFGGMSGVGYGLLGYVWMKGRYDPGDGMMLHPQTVVWMMAWFAMCLVGIVPGVANYAHGAGLAVGMLVGGGAALLRRARR